MPNDHHPTVVRPLDDAEYAAPIAEYIQAIETADLERMLDLLHDDAMWSLPPVPSWHHGHEAIARFLQSGPFTERWRHQAIMANGQPAVASYVHDGPTDRFRAYSIDIIAIEHGRIRSVTAFVDAQLFTEFGLPAELS